LHAGWNLIVREAFNQTDKHIHLRAFNGETLKFMFEMATIVPGGKDQLKECPEEPDLIGMTALLTTIMPSIKATIEALTEAGLRDNVKVIVGGAPVTAKYASEAGTDRYAHDAAADDTARKLLPY